MRALPAVRALLAVRAPVAGMAPLGERPPEVGMLAVVVTSAMVTSAMEWWAACHWGLLPLHPGSK